MDNRFVIKFDSSGGQDGNNDQRHRVRPTSVGHAQSGTLPWGHFVIERNGEPIALLTPVGARPGATWREIMALGDLRPPGDGFADDLEAIQANQPLAEFVEWPSS